MVDPSTKRWPIIQDILKRVAGSENSWGKVEENGR